MMYLHHTMVIIYCPIQGRKNYYRIYRIDTLGCSIVKKFGFESITGDSGEANYNTSRICLSKDNKTIGILGDEDRCYRPAGIHIKYLYLN